MPVSDEKMADFYQSIIGRMAENSSRIKGWSVALATAIFGFAVKEQHYYLPFVAVFSSLVFWILDSYYLVIERNYRELFNEKINKPTSFEGKIPKVFVTGSKFASAMFSTSTVLLYGMLSLSSTILVVILKLYQR